MLNTCQSDCDRGAWRYCPHCGRLLPESPSTTHQGFTLADIAALRGRGLSWSAAGKVFGYASGEPLQRHLRKEQRRWLRASRRMLAKVYHEGGGRLEQARYTLAVMRHEPGAFAAYLAANREFDSAIGLLPLERFADHDQNGWLAAATTGDLPGPVTNWPAVE